MKDAWKVIATWIVIIILCFFILKFAVDTFHREKIKQPEKRTQQRF